MNNNMWWILVIGVFVALAVRKGGAKLSVVLAAFALGVMLAGTAFGVMVHTAQDAAEEQGGGFLSHFLDKK